MKPEKKTTATMKTTPATMPTHAAATVTRLRRGSRSTYVGGDGAVATGPVAGSEDVGVSLMNPMVQAVLMCAA